MSQSLEPDIWLWFSLSRILRACLTFCGEKCNGPERHRPHRVLLQATPDATKTGSLPLQICEGQLEDRRGLVALR